MSLFIIKFECLNAFMCFLKQNIFIKCLSANKQTIDFAKLD